jgi:hypothetical protein
MMDRQARCIVGPQGRLFHGLFSRPFASALAHLSTAALALRCHQEDPARFEEALEKAAARAERADGW